MSLIIDIYFSYQLFEHLLRYYHFIEGNLDLNLIFKNYNMGNC